MYFIVLSLHVQYMFVILTNKSSNSPLKFSKFSGVYCLFVNLIFFKKGEDIYLLYCFNYILPSFI